MTQRRKWIQPQFVFPAAILLAFAAVIIASAFRPPQTFTAVRLAEAGSTSSVIWPEIDEETFYQEMSVALSVSITAGPEHYEIKEPWEEQAHPVDVYEFFIGDLLADARKYPLFESGKIFRIHGLPDALAELNVAEQENCFLLFLHDRRDTEDFMPHKGYSAYYYKQYFDTFGYEILAPNISVIPGEYDGTVKTELLPEYLRGEGEYTSWLELSAILAAGREKFGIKEFDTQS